MRLRAHPDLQADPAFPFMVGRLVGAAEAASILLQTPQQAGDLTTIGKHLGDVAGWFLTGKTVEPPPPPADTQIGNPPLPSEADTQIRKKVV